VKLKDIPAPIWYMAGAVAAAVAVFHLVKRGAAAIGQAVNPTNPNNVANQAATGAAQAAGLVPEGRTIGGTLFEGVQAITGFFTGTPTDNEIIATPTVVSTPLGNPRDGNAPGSGGVPP
jgi:hypothetical protein